MVLALVLAGGLLPQFAGIAQGQSKDAKSNTGKGKIGLAFTFTTLHTLGLGPKTCGTAFKYKMKMENLTGSAKFSPKLTVIAPFGKQRYKLAFANEKIVVFIDREPGSQEILIFAASADGKSIVAYSIFGGDAIMPADRQIARSARKLPFERVKDDLQIGKGGVMKWLHKRFGVGAGACGIWISAKAPRKLQIGLNEALRLVETPALSETVTADEPPACTPTRVRTVMIATGSPIIS